MNTPWGKSDYSIKIQRGVSWVNTPSHGGLRLTWQAAMKTLSPEARKAGERYGQWLDAPFFFEEDCAYAIAFYEHPEWKTELERKEMLDNVGVSFIPKTDAEIKSDMEAVIRRWFPQYFTRQEAK